MTSEELSEAFEAVETNSHEWHMVTNRLAKRPDLHAFMLLDSLLSPHIGNSKDDSDRYTQGMIASAEHDQIWLAVDIEEFAKVATPEIILDLVRCGVFYDNDIESLSMFR